jgi:4a-hydroxytetrahydrobiopterin dehydratase
MWRVVNDQLIKDFEFLDFKEAFEFLNKVAEESEKLNHHPTIINTYNKVEIRLTTHSAGNKVTDKDYELSNQIDKIVQ